MKLYYSPQTRAVRVRWLLEELEAPYELVRVSLRDKPTDHPHPHGAVPVFVDGELTLIESAAICMYIADKLPERGLAPPPGSPGRGLYYQWIVYAMATVEPEVIRAASHSQMLPVEKRDPEILKAARDKIAEQLGFIERGLAGQEFLVGKFSAADVVLGGVVNWARLLGLVSGFANVEAWSDRLRGRPALKRARAD
jgi:glutathione S-transferase